MKASVRGNLYEYTPEQLAAAGIEELPRILDEAVKTFAADPFITKVLGQELRDEFITYKAEEWRQYHQTVSQWEVDRYARLFWGGGSPAHSKGFTTSMPVPVKSTVFRVTTLRRYSRAVAASRPSTTGSERAAVSRPQRSATEELIGRISCS